MVMSRLIEREVGKKKLDTYQVNRATPMYENDMLIFSKVNTKFLRSILEELSLYTGLEINFAKSYDPKVSGM